LRVYIKNLKGEPLMPTTPRKARVLLKVGLARVVTKNPFVIQLNYATGETKQEIVAGMDTGSKKVGCAATANGGVVYQAEVTIRDDVSKKMEQRKMYRRTRRGRKTRYRAPRFLNRGKAGKLAPSVLSKVNSHLREKLQVESILPVTRWKVETASFDIAKITNPEVSGKGYQEGPQKDFYNVKAFVLHRDGHECRSGQKQKHSKKLQIHHIIFRSEGGTNTPSNLITLCEDCHCDLHAGKYEFKAKKSKTKHAAEIGIVKSQLRKLWGPFEETFGYETKYKREQCLELPKTHCNDAIAICCEDEECVELSNTSYLKRHVASGDYRQTKGKRSDIRIPTGKLFGLRKFDRIQTSKGTGFVKGKRSRGFFAVATLGGSVISNSVNIKKNCQRLQARTTTLIEERSGTSSL